jgi:hypothetical protein
MWVQGGGSQRVGSLTLQGGWLASRAHLADIMARSFAPSHETDLLQHGTGMGGYSNLCEQGKSSSKHIFFYTIATTPHTLFVPGTFVTVFTFLCRLKKYTT